MQPTNTTQQNNSKQKKTTFENNLVAIFTTKTTPKEVSQTKQPTTPKVKTTQPCSHCNYNTQNENKVYKEAMLQFIDIVLPEIQEDLERLNPKKSSNKSYQKIPSIQKNYITLHPERCFKTFVVIIQGLCNKESEYTSLSQKIPQNLLTSYILCLFCEFLKKFTFEFKNTKVLIDPTTNLLAQIKKTIQEELKSTQNWNLYMANKYFYMALDNYLKHHKLEIPEHLFTF